MQIQIIEGYPHLTPILEYFKKQKTTFNSDLEEIGMATLIDGYIRYSIKNQKFLDEDLIKSNKVHYHNFLKLFNYIIQNQKIDLIKDIRTRTGKTLVDAKKLADSLFELAREYDFNSMDNLNKKYNIREALMSEEPVESVDNEF